MKTRLSPPPSPATLALLALPMCALACGGAPAAALPATTPAPVAAAPREAKVDLSAVAEPSSLMMYGRIAKPSAVTEVVAGWLRSQLPGVPQPGSDAVSEVIAGESVGDIVDMEQPIDMAAAVALQLGRPGVTFAVSAAVKDPVRARAAFSSGSMKLVPGDNGLLRIEGLGAPKDAAEARDHDHDEEDDDDERSCALVPAFGAAPLRLVCGFGRRALKGLAPYLTRTTPRLPSNSDVHVELRFELVHAFLADNGKSVPILVSALLGQAGLSGPAARDLVTAAASETLDLAHDLSSMTLDMKLTDASAEATLSTKLTSATSVTARMALSHPERVDVAPPAFLRLPADADVAVYSRGYDDADFIHPRELVANAIAEELAKEGVTSADAKALTDALGKLVDASPTVYASGFDDAALAKALTTTAPKRGASIASRASDAAVVNAVLGYRLLGIESPSARVVATARELVAASTRPTLTKWLKAQAAPTPIPTLKITPVAKTAGLPKETLHLELTMTPPTNAPEVTTVSARPGTTADPKQAAPAKATPAKPMKLHLLIVPDGARTWIAFGLDEVLLAARARGVLAGAPDAGTLAGRPGVEAVRDAKSNGGGFFTIHGLAAMMSALDLVDGHRDAAVARSQAGVVGATSKGATVMPFLVRVANAPVAGAGGTTALTLTIPKAAIEDMVQLGMRGTFRM